MLSLPRLYAILDIDTVTARGLELRAVPGIFDEWLAAGVRLIQLRAKNLASGEFLDLAKDLVKRAHAANSARAENAGGAGISILINDRADIALMSGADGVHVGQEDLQPKALRALRDLRVIGLSTHNLDQLRAALDEPADYFAIGPVFSTSSKANADSVVGLEGVRAAAGLLASKGDERPLVAIGGITPGTAPEVFRAGAASVAMISGLFTYRITTFLPEAF